MTSKKKGMTRRAKLAKGKTEIDKSNIKAMANSMRAQILTILNERANSTTGMARELGVEPGELAYDVEVLRKMGRIKVVDEKKRRGAVEVFYKAVARAHLDEFEWPVVPDPVKGGLRASLLQAIVDDAVAAVDEETYDSVEGAHMSWTPVIVDKEGWDELTEILRVALRGVLDVSKSSAQRMMKRNEAGMSCTISMLGYRSAVEDRKVGPPVTPSALRSTTKPDKRKARKSKATKPTKGKGHKSR
jgi:DNA-binding transcriptional ArsR family regulator